MARSTRPIGSRALRLALIYVVLIVAFVLLMTAAYALPQQRIMANLRASLPVLEAEGMYPRILVEGRSLGLDNFTDALMMDTAVVTDSRGPLVDGLADSNGIGPGNVKGDRIASLRLSAEGERRRATAYARYWHGYQVFLRPALIAMTYPGIRYLNLLLLAALSVTALLYLRAKAGLSAAVSYFAALALTGFLVVPMSLQFSSVTYLMLLATLAVLGVAERDSFGSLDIELFFVVGMLTAFFDLLTAPLLTLGMPLAVVLILLGRRDPERTLRADALLAVKLAVSWAGGYLATVGAKAALASLVLRIDVIGDTTAAMAERSGLTTGPRMMLWAVRRNLIALFPTFRVDAGETAGEILAQNVSVAVLVLTVLAVLVAVVVANRRRAGAGRAASHVLLLAPVPYLWYLVASQHSSVHYWFTYRIQAIALFAALYVVLASLGGSQLAGRVRRSITALADRTLGEGTDPSEQGD